MVTILKERRDFITPYRFDAKGDAELFRNNSCTQGSAVVTNTTDSPFRPQHVGKAVYVQGGLLNGGTLITTVLSYQSATQITLASNVLGATGVKRLLIGTDDTAAINRARAYARRRGKALLLSGSFIAGPMKMGSREAMVGESRVVGGLFLKPGSATADKFLLSNLAATDYGIAIESMTLNGLRDFQTNGAGVLLTDIDVIKHVGSGDNTVEVDAYNIYRDLRVREANRAALKYSGKGQSKFIDLVLTHSTYGLDLNSADNLIQGVNASAYGAAFYLGSGVVSSRFVGSKGSVSGYSPQTGMSGAVEQACWSLNGASRNEFTACEGAESWASVLVMSDAHKNVFSAFRISDPGCLYGAHALGANSSGEVRAGIRMIGCNENHFQASAIGIGGHGTTNYATHALYAEGSCVGNTGNITVDQDMTFATVKVGRTHTGERNSLVIDDEPMDADDDSHIDNQRFLAGSFF